MTERTQSCGCTINKNTHFYCETLNSYEHLHMNKFCESKFPPVPPGSAANGGPIMYMYNKGKQIGNK